MAWLLGAGGGAAAGGAAAGTAAGAGAAAGTGAALGGAAAGAGGQGLASMAAGGNFGAANAALTGGQIGGALGTLGDVAGIASQFQAPPPASAPFPMSQAQPSMIGQATQQPERPQPSYYLTPLGRVGVRPILPTV